jgi:hypothetical protein
MCGTGWVDGWMDEIACLKIAYGNEKICLRSFEVTSFDVTLSGNMGSA